MGIDAVGHKAFNLGKDYENELEITHDTYANMGIAHINKLPVPTVPAPYNYKYMLSRIKNIGNKIWGTLRVLSKKQGYDFFGMFGSNAGPDDAPWLFYGQAIAVESKCSSVTHTSLPIIAEEKYGFGIHYHQLTALATAYRDFGVISLIVWQNGERHMVLMPEMVLRAFNTYEEAGRKSISVKDFVHYDIVTYDDNIKVHDYLYVARVWMQTGGKNHPWLAKRKEYKMIPFTIDITTKELIVGDGDETIKIDHRGLPRETIVRIASEAKTIEEFVDKVKRTSIAYD